MTEVEDLLSCDGRLRRHIQVYEELKAEFLGFNPLDSDESVYLERLFYKIVERSKYIRYAQKDKRMLERLRELMNSER